jgi:predicted ArsR family transcriptional regulator
MVTQREVLTFIDKRTAEGPAVTAQDLARKFWVSPDCACGHLRRLWRERLVETVSARPRGFRFRLEPGEPILPLRFRLSARGKERLRWYEQHDEGDEVFRLDDVFRLFR